MSSFVVCAPVACETVRMARTRRTPKGDGTEDWHGKSSGYDHHRCGCARCKAWKRDDVARYRANRTTLPKNL